MTCIVALKHKGVVYMGADSAAANEWTSISQGDRKLFKRGPYVMGGTTDYRMIQILKHGVKWPDQIHNDPDRHAYNITELLRPVFTDLNFAALENNKASAGQFLIAWGKHLYNFHDFQYNRAHCGYESVGSGYMVALGSLYSTAGQAPKTRIKTALSASAALQGTVKPPFHILATG